MEKIILELVGDNIVFSFYFDIFINFVDYYLYNKNTYYSRKFAG